MGMITGELVESVFQHFYPQLVQILPMDDVTFIAQLFSVNLLPGDAKDLMGSHPTQASKASWFLDRMIKPSVKTGIGGKFNNLIKVMEHSEYDNVKELAKFILKKQVVNSETHLSGMYFKIFSADDNMTYILQVLIHLLTNILLL